MKSEHKVSIIALKNACSKVTCEGNLVLKLGDNTVMTINSAGYLRGFAPIVKIEG
jgi:hypothetical protein